jgi:N-acetylmuramoyl-L-alanine amidase
MNKDRFTIFLDAGHGGLNPKFHIPHRYTTYPSKCFQHNNNIPYHGYGWFFEGVFNRDLAKLLEAKLLTEGFNVIKLYHEIDDTPLKARIIKANNYKNYEQAILISIHGNAGMKGANGWEIFTSPGKSKSDEIATYIYDEVKNTNLFRMRPDITEGDPDKEANFYVLTQSKVPAVLSENGFFTDRNDSNKMFSKEGQEKLADAHFRGIVKYFLYLDI